MERTLGFPFVLASIPSKCEYKFDVHPSKQNEFSNIVLKSIRKKNLDSIKEFKLKVGFEAHLLEYIQQYATGEWDQNINETDVFRLLALATHLNLNSMCSIILEHVDRTPFDYHCEELSTCEYDALKKLSTAT